MYYYEKYKIKIYEISGNYKSRFVYRTVKLMVDYFVENWKNIMA